MRRDQAGRETVPEPVAGVRGRRGGVHGVPASSAALGVRLLVSRCGVRDGGGQRQGRSEASPSERSVVVVVVVVGGVRVVRTVARPIAGALFRVRGGTTTAVVGRGGATASVSRRRWLLLLLLRNVPSTRRSGRVAAATARCGGRRLRLLSCVDRKQKQTHVMIPWRSGGGRGVEAARANNNNDARTAATVFDARASGRPRRRPSDETPSRRSSPTRRSKPLTGPEETGWEGETAGAISSDLLLII